MNAVCWHVQPENCQIQHDPRVVRMLSMTRGMQGKARQAILERRIQHNQVVQTDYSTATDDIPLLPLQTY